MSRALITLALCVAAAGDATTRQPASPAGTVRQAVDVVAPVAPLAVPTGGRHRIAYELHVTSFAPAPLRLTGLDVRGPTGATILHFGGPQLAALLEPVGPTDDDRQRLARGRRVVLYLDLDVVDVPAALLHRLTYVDDTGAARTLDLPPMAVDRRAAAVLGPPLGGGPWVAVYAPEMARGHRRVLYATGGRVRLPGRFAVDWFKVDEGGATSRDGGDTPAGWPGHGAEVLAVADGVVAAMRDDIAEPARFRGAPPVAIGDATGNFVALDVGGGRYVFYEHLARGVSVRTGQRVRRGQVLGRVGASGQATGAHLHLHVADAASPLDAEGLPFVIEGAEVLGGYPTIDAVFRGQRWNDDGRGETRAAFPRPNVVLRFR